MSPASPACGRSQNVSVPGGRERTLESVAEVPSSTLRQARTKTPFVAPIVERSNVREEVIQPVSVRRVLGCVPVFRKGEFAVEATFRLGLVVNRIESNDSLQEDVELGMGRGISRDFEKRLEDV